MPSDDAALVRAAQAGDVAALGALLERHRALLHAVAVSMLGHGPQAEDAVHDAFVVALRRIGDLRDPAAARAWLRAIVSNVCLAQLRRPTVELRDEPIDAPTADTVQEALERCAVRDWVWTALGRLSEPLRLPLILRHFSEASSYEAIAEICGVPVGTVRSRLNAARARLADELLATAAAPHERLDEARLRAQDIAAAMATFERTGDVALLRDVFTDDVAFRMFDGVEQRGRERFAAAMTSDFADGVTTRPLRMIVGPDIAVVELLLISPTEQPLHCPPAVTQVHSHGGGLTHRVVSHYAPWPAGAHNGGPSATERASRARGTDAAPTQRVPAGPR
jgi:RNA polymerase sigma-70 factor (ECF subfamily)